MWLWPLPVVTTQGNGFNFQIRANAETSKRFIADLNESIEINVD